MKWAPSTSIKEWKDIKENLQIIKLYYQDPNNLFDLKVEKAIEFIDRIIESVLLKKK